MDQEKLNKDIEKCRKCKGLNIPKKTMSAPGYGNINSKLMVIGQSLHGYNSNTEPQIPFVGPVESMDSGKLLYRILKKVGYTLRKKNFFITNIVHCHPPENRTSLKQEIENCKFFLKQELRMVEPKIIIVLGKDAREWFELQKIPSGKYAYTTSKIFNDRARLFVIVHHPSYVMRHLPGKKNIYEMEVTKILKEIL